MGSRPPDDAPAPSRPPTFPLIVALPLAIGIAVALGVGLTASRLALPMSETAFALAAVAVGYLGVERQRLRRDARALAVAVPLGVTALAALGHVAYQAHAAGHTGAALLGHLAMFVAIAALVVALLHEHVRRARTQDDRMHRLHGLHEAAHALVSSLDPHETVRTVASRALSVSGASVVVLYRAERHVGGVVPAAHAAAAASELTGVLQASGAAAIAARALAERRAIALADGVVNGPLVDQVPDDLRGHGIRAAVAIPLVSRDADASGVVAAFYREPRAPLGDDLDLLAAFGTLAAVALDNARSFDELALKARHDATLQAFGQRLLQVTTETAVLEDAVTVAHDLMDAPLVSAFLLDAKGAALDLVAGHGWAAGTVGATSVARSAESLLGHACLRCEAIDAEDLGNDPRFTMPPHLVAHAVRAGLVMPIALNDQPVGVLAAFYRAPHRFSDEERRVLASLAHQTVLAIDRVRLYVELQANLARLRETQAQLIQADKLTALGTLLSGMAHELNNPLSTIQLSVQLMKRQPLSDHVRRRMDAVEEECERASRIIKDLLIFARRKPPERRAVDLNRVIKGVLTLQGPELELNKIRIASDLAPLPPIMADGHQLQQVFLNLFTNARHAMTTAHGRGQLAIRTRQDNGHVVVEVQDDGPGIPAEHLGRIFDPFFTTKGTGEGTGLGLSLSIGIVQAHGGTMTAENLPEGGARFIVRLPVNEAPRTPARAVRASDTPVPRRRGRVLLVDDEAKLRATLTEVFTALGHTVAAVGTGRGALEALDRSEFDVIALDMRLPDVDGMTVWQGILARNGSLASRVLFMTGDTMSPETQRFLHESGRPVLMKPFTIDRIERMVDQMLAETPPGAVR
jgi:signal transduction histidine kinase/ActR/RegA family two-component response regulator